MGGGMWSLPKLVCLLAWACASTPMSSAAPAARVQSKCSDVTWKALEFDSYLSSAVAFPASVTALFHPKRLVYSSSSRLLTAPECSALRKAFDAHGHQHADLRYEESPAL